MKRGVVKTMMILAALAWGGCGNDSGSSAGGTCKTADSCWTVSSPSGYDVKSECGLVSGTTFSTSACVQADYKRKCTQDTMTTDNGKTTTVTYVYLFSAASTTTCLGTETQL